MQQSYSNLEIVLVDDGSTDRSTVICREWECKDRRIIYIRQEHTGLGAARNKGIKNSNGDYVTFLDSDDWIEPTFIEKLLRSMLENDSEISQCDIYYVDSLTFKRQLIKLRYDGNVVSCSNKSVVNKSRLFAWGKIFKRTLLERCRFSFPLIVYEDICIPLLIIQAKRISYVPDPLINYFRNRQGSLSNDYRNICDITKGLRILYEKLNELGLYLDYKFEYKKILLGQIRFAYRKWSDLSNEQVMRLFQELNDFAVTCFPGLSDVLTKKYFAFDKEILVQALDKAIPNKKQLTKNVFDANFIIAFERDVLKISNSNIPIIIVSNCLDNEVDSVAKSFNIAEQIMEKL